MNDKLTELIVILDASGSMGRRKRDVIGGFNQLIEDQKKHPDACNVTVINFSSFKEQHIIMSCVPVEQVTTLSENDYRTSGWTALYDAIGSTIDSVGERLSNTNECDRPGKVIVTIITDGEENDSREYTVDRIRAMVTHQQDVYDWKFIFTGANQDAVLEGTKLGVNRGLIANYQPTSKGYEQTFSGISFSCSALRSGDSEAASACIQDIEK